MSKYNLPYAICVTILVWQFVISCRAQENPNLPASTTNQKPTPQIIGTPLLPNGQPGLTYDPELVSQYIRSIFQDSKGNFWFGPAGHSVVRYDVKTLRYFTSNEFFEGNTAVDPDYSSSVHAITEDKNGNIWFGTDRGAVKYDGKRFRSYTEKDGLTNINIGRKCILVDKAGKVWIGTKGGIFQYDPSAENLGIKCFRKFALILTIKVTDMMEDKTGNIWFATEGNGVFRYDGKTIQSLTEKEGLGDNYAGGLAQDKAGNMWFLMKNGISRYDGKTFTDITAADGLGGSEFWGILIEKSGIIWVTARGATTRYDPSIPISSPKAFTVFRPEDGLNCCVQSMYQDRSGNMWWGTGQGLYRFDGTHFYQVKRNGPW